MPEADGYVRIETKLDDAGLIKKMASIGNTINRQTAALEKAKENAAALANELARVTQPGYMSKEAKAFEKELANSEKTVSKLQQQFDALADKLDERSELNINGNFNEEIAELQEQLGTVGAKLDEAKMRAEELRVALARAKENPGGSQEAMELEQKLRLADEDVKRLEADLSNSRQVLASMKAPAEGVNESIKNTSKSSKGLSAYIGKLAKRMLLLYAFRRVFTYIRNSIMSMSGLSVVTGVFTEFNNKIKEMYSSNEQIQAALAKLRGSLYTAFQPIYSAVVPALTTLINWLARGIQYIAAFFSAISGKKLSESADGARDLAKGVNAVGGAAKKASAQLATFDKLNTLTEESGGGGGGGAGAVDFDSDLGVDEDKLALWERIGNRIREIIQNIKDNIKAFLDFWNNEATPEQKVTLLVIALSLLIPLLFTLLSWPLALIATLAILIAVVEKYYDQITGWLSSAYEKVHDFFTGAADAIKEHVANAQQWLNEHLGFLGHIISAVLDVVQGGLLILWHAVETVVKLVINVINAVVQTIHAIATGDWKKAWEAWKRVFFDLWNGIKQIAIDVVNVLIGVFENFINSAISWINALLNGLNTVGRWFGASWSLGIGEVHIPRFAGGGQPDAGSLFIAGEAGPELVMSSGHNSEVINEAQLVQAFRQASSEQVALMQQQNSLLAAILDKELTFKPSASAGRAFQQSINLYARGVG